MAQLTIYLDDESIHRIESAAAKENSSVSKWVKTRLIQSLEEEWPSDYSRILGSLGGSDIERPGEAGFGLDATRESL